LRPRLKIGRTVTHLRRYRHIVAVLMKYGFRELSDSIARGMRSRWGRSAASVRVREADLALERPRRVRLALEELGPTFVKLGQLLSTRPDLIPQAYIDELELLQDQVSPLKFEQIRQQVEAELKAPLGVLFREFDEQPIAAGSVAQVHRAVTTAGEVVAVKVRRPGIVQTIATECEILEGLAGWVKSSQRNAQTIDPVRLVREFTEAVSNEVHLLRELANQQRFVRMFAGDATVAVPRPLEALCTDGVLTMEYIQGVKPTDRAALSAAGLDASLIARRGVEFVLTQVFDFGYFHTDPHPGNFLIQAGNVVTPLDFGQVARIGAADRALLGELVRSIVDVDAERLVAAFDRFDMLSTRTDEMRLAREIDDMLHAYHDLPLKQIPFGRMMMQTFEVIRTNNVHPPATFTLMLKAITTIEALARSLDSDFDLIELLAPRARKMAAEKYSPGRLWDRARQAIRDAASMAVGLPEDVQSILRKIKRGQFQVHVQHEHLEQLIATLDKASNRISFAFIIAGLLVASSLLVSQTSTWLWFFPLQTLGGLGYVVAAILGIWLLVSIIRSRRL
jgi:ubiquinone biosynthesis protein